MNWLKDTWAKVRADAVNALALASTGLGSAMAHIDDVATALGDPNLNQQLHTVITDVKTWGRWVMLVGIIGTIARFKKLVQSPPKP